MEIFKRIYNVFRIFFAIILSIILVGLVCTTPLIATATSLLSADTFHKVINTLDMSRVSESFFSPDETIEVNGITMTIPHEILDSPLMKDILILYFDSIFAVIEGNDPANILTVSAVKDITNQYTDELLPVLKKNISADVPLSDEMLQQILDSTIETLIPSLLATLPTTEEMGIHSTTITTLQKIHNGTFLTYALLAIGIFSILLYLCRFSRFQGFVWLGIVYMVSAILNLIFALLSSTGVHFLSASNDLSEIEYIITPLFTIMTETLYQYAKITALLGLLFFFLFFICRKFFTNKKPIHELTA